MKLERDGGGGPRERGCRTDPAFGRLARSAAPGPPPAALLTSYRWPRWISRISGTSPGSTGRRCPSGSLQRACAPADSVSGERGRRGTAGAPARFLRRGKACRGGWPRPGMTQPAGVTVCAVSMGRIISRAYRPARRARVAPHRVHCRGLPARLGCARSWRLLFSWPGCGRPWRAGALAGCWVWPGQAADHPRVMPAFGL